MKAVGYTSCFAAYMGTNVGSLDLFDIKRFGVNWRVGLTAFEALIEGW